LERIIIATVGFAFVRLDVIGDAFFNERAFSDERETAYSYSDKYS